MKIQIHIIKRLLITVLLGTVISIGCKARETNIFLTQDEQSSDIRLNQIGFYPGGPKVAIVLNAKTIFFAIRDLQNQKIVYNGQLHESAMPALNGKKNFIADFSSFQSPGKYTLVVEGIGMSYPFTISNEVHRNVAKASMKAFYFQRVSTDLPEKYAGKWNRVAGHLDDQVLIHPSAATAGRPTGFQISAPGGWYDAGDYNKYIVNSGITMGTMLSLCEDFPEYIRLLDLDISESNNSIPDVLDELIYNLRWMLAMQDPDDGGVYHKLTNASFDGMVMPDFTKDPRYVVQKSTAATLNFSAVAAQASRILKLFEKELPGLSDSCLAASVKAWNWAQLNPDVAYNQEEMNAKYDPKVTTGDYGDRYFSDEFIWAASELYLTSKDEKYYKAVNMFPDSSTKIPSWSNVRILGYYSLLRHEKMLTGVAKRDYPILKKSVLTLADRLIDGTDQRAYRTVMGKNGSDFIWGSNSVAANQGIALIQAYLLTGNNKYVDYALSNLDYLFGRNATGYCYVTGFGCKSPMYPHHRPSVADGITAPVPGFMVGGPNPAMQDKIAVASFIPDEGYIDDERSYATNEVAINWNAPLVYLSNALEALQFRCQYPKEKIRN